MDFFATRRARLRQAFARLYPEIVPEVWMSAWWATQLVRRANYRYQRLVDGQRVLPDAHFEFQGGKVSRQTRTGVLTPRIDARASMAGARREA